MYPVWRLHAVTKTVEGHGCEQLAQRRHAAARPGRVSNRRPLDRKLSRRHATPWSFSVHPGWCLMRPRPRPRFWPPERSRHRNSGLETRPNIWPQDQDRDFGQKTSLVSRSVSPTVCHCAPQHAILGSFSGESVENYIARDGSGQSASGPRRVDSAAVGVLKRPSGRPCDDRPTPYRDARCTAVSKHRGTVVECVGEQLLCPPWGGIEQCRDPSVCRFVCLSVCLSVPCLSDRPSVALTVMYRIEMTKHIIKRLTLVVARIFFIFYLKIITFWWDHTHWTHQIQVISAVWGFFFASK